MTDGVLALIDHTHLPILLIIGMGIIFGTVGAGVFQRLRIPQVVGYIVIGLVAGRSGFGLFDAATLQRLQPISFFALGIIGFMVGGELRYEVFRKYGKSFLCILLAEGLGSFVLVSVLVTGGCFLLTGDLTKSVVLGILLGAISSPTAPAATVDVLWEYKTRGILTTTVFAIVALDDGLGLILYALMASVAGLLIGDGSVGLWSALGRGGYELLGAVVIGAAFGFVLNLALRRTRGQGKWLPLIIGALALAIGLARALGVDLLLSTMTLGLTLANLAPRRSEKAFDLIRGVAAPIYVLFFVAVGARLYVSGMSGWMWALAGAYVVGRTVGKMLGAHLGARWVSAPPAVRKYLGLCLFSQAGVAIGLAILSGDRFSGEIGTVIVAIVTATTFLVQIVGPPSVKLAVSRAGEVGLNVTELDLLESYKVGQMMDASPVKLAPDTPLSAILRIIAETDATVYPVTDKEDRLIGVISIEQLRQTFLHADLADLLVAFDMMRLPPDTVGPDLPLGEAVEKMRQQNLESMPVLSASADGVLAGILELRKVERRLSREIIDKQRVVDADWGDKPAPTGCE